MKKPFYGTLLALAVLTLATLPFAWKFGDASSHREAPLISQDPTADLTDVYAFVTLGGTVTLAFNVIPFEEPAGGPNFYHFDDNVLYALRIDNDGDAVEDHVFEFRFTTEILNPGTFLYNTGPITTLDDPDYNFRQRFAVTHVDVGAGASTPLGSSLLVPPDHIGPVSTPGYEALAEQAVHDLGGGIKVFAGQRDDPFWVDLGAVFDLLTIRPSPPGNSGGGLDGLGGFNVHTIALQVPVPLLTADKAPVTGPDDLDAVIGVWATTHRPTTTIFGGGTVNTSGPFVQVSRLAIPLVNEVLIPLSHKDLFNASEPADDASQFGSFLLDPEPARLLALLYGIEVPDAPRTDLVPLLTGIPGLNEQPGVPPSDMLRLNMGIPPKVPGDPGFSRLGVLGGDLSGFPNGRRLYDDVVDIELQVLAGVLVPGFNKAPNNQLGDNVPFNDLPFLEVFPYLATPHQGFLHEHHLVSEPPPPPEDTTPPQCEIEAVIEGPPKVLQIRVQDTGSGLSAINVRKAQNVNVAVPAFPQGTTDALTITATKLDEAKRSAVALEVFDVAGNSRVCDPVAATVSAEVPESFTLEANYPNPFNPTTSIRFQLAEATPVTLKVFDLTGRLVRTLLDEELTAGTYAVEWDGRDDLGQAVASGTYIYRLATDNFVKARKMTLLK